MWSLTALFVAGVVAAFGQEPERAEPKTEAATPGVRVRIARPVRAVQVRAANVAVPERKTRIFRLKNAPASDVANAIGNFLKSERLVQLADPNSGAAAKAVEREVVVVAEPVSNSLIISAAPRMFETVLELVEKLDQQPPAVSIRVLIAEATFGQDKSVEKGRKDKKKKRKAGAAKKRSAGKKPNDLLSFLAGQLEVKADLDGSVLRIPRTDHDALVATLQKFPGLKVLSRPQIMTLDNQPAFVQIGERVPMVRGVPAGKSDQLARVEYQNVGLILGVTPRISPDGNVVMEIDVEKSKLGPVEEGIPVSILADGKVIRAPRINTTSMQTTISLSDGQTVVLGRLTARSGSQRIETLVLLTPTIVRDR